MIQMMVIIVCRVSSKIYNHTYDVFINECAECGLKLPGVHKVATLQKKLAEMVIGSINETLKAKIKVIISNLAD